MRCLIFLSFLIVAFTIATSLTSVSGQDRQNFVTVKAGVYTPNDDLEDLDSDFAPLDPHPEDMFYKWRFYHAEDSEKL